MLALFFREEWVTQLQTLEDEKFFWLIAGMQTDFT